MQKSFGREKETLLSALLSSSSYRRQWHIKLYDIIYADPPWPYSKYNPKNTSMGRHKRALNPQKYYSTMTKQELADLFIPAKKNALLFLWVTNAHLPLAFDLLKHWNFTYRTHIIWDKRLPSSPHWHHSVHESFLICKRGKFPRPQRPTKIPYSIISIRKTVHSQKPGYFYHLINEWYPEKSKIELFARVTSTGFDTFGDQVAPYKYTILDDYFYKVSEYRQNILTDFF